MGFSVKQMTLVRELQFECQQEKMREYRGGSGLRNTEGDISPPLKWSVGQLTDLQDGLLQRAVDLQGTGVGLEVTLGSDQIHQL